MKRFCSVGLSAYLTIVGSALGQEPTIAPELLSRNFSVSGDSIRFCIGETAYQRPLEEALVQEIASSLLVDAEVHYYPPQNFPVDYDYVIGPTLDEIYILLNNECDAFMGMNFVRDLADWVTYSRPLYTTNFVLVVPNHAEADSLFDFGAAHTIGTRVLSVGDLRLGSYLRLQDRERRPTRVPYGDNAIIIEKLATGELDAALIWEPALSGLLTEEQMAEFRIVDLGNMVVPEVTFGIIFQSKNTFVRGLIDAAIEQLEESGVIENLVRQAYSHSVKR